MKKPNIPPSWLKYVTAPTDNAAVFIWARKHAGLTQEEAARKLGTTRRSVNRWECRENKIPPVVLGAFLSLTGINPAEVPRPREYDDKGYPVAIYEHFEAEVLADPTAEEAHRIASALANIEGKEYPMREVERARILLSGSLIALAMPRDEREQWLEGELADVIKRNRRYFESAKKQGRIAEPKPVLPLGEVLADAVDEFKTNALPGENVRQYQARIRKVKKAADLC